MKQALEIISTDWHLKTSNLDEIFKLVSDQCQLALSLNLKRIICLGDVFDSRISQRIDVLIAFYRILQLCVQNNLKLVCIPGNHDKTDYENSKSFLSPFKYHSNLRLIESYECFCSDKYNLHFIPYFDEKALYKKVLSRVQYKGNDVLFSHVSVTGSVNNDGTVIENILKPTDFKKFSKVFLGHYHNYQTIDDRIVHIPSIRQNNYGEYALKGYTILYDDLTYEIKQSNCKMYYKKFIDLDEVDISEIDQIIKESDCENSHVQLMFTGNESKLKAVNPKHLQNLGFDVRIVKKDIMQNMQMMKSNEIKLFDKHQIILLFKKFCEQEKYDFERGSYFLDHTINKNSLLTFKSRT